MFRVSDFFGIFVFGRDGAKVSQNFFLFNMYLVHMDRRKFHAVLSVCLHLGSNLSYNQM